MPSTKIAVFFIVLQLTQNIGCYADYRNTKESSLWDTIKETINKAIEILMFGAKIVRYVVDALVAICTSLPSCCACGMTVISTIIEAVSGASIWEILTHGIRTVFLAIVSMLGLPYLLPIFGFGAGGITAGSFAAWFQSVWFGGTIGGITGWIFSALQSIGAGGLGAAGMAVITFFSGILDQLYEYIV